MKRLCKWAVQQPVFPVPQAVVPFSDQSTEAAHQKPVHTKHHWTTEEKDLIQDVFFSLLPNSHMFLKKIQASIIRSKLDSTPSFANIKSRHTFAQIKDKLWALFRNKPTYP